MPRAPTSSSLSPGTLSQCRPLSVCESERTREMGSEFELPKTPMAVTKLEARLLNRNTFATRTDTVQDTKVWTMKITGMMARSESFSALSCEASFVKTGRCQCLKELARG